MNQPEKMPLCMCPTTIPCVDDEKSFLTDIALSQDGAKVCYSLRLNPVHLLEEVNAQKNLSPIHPATHMYNADRFARISVVISDFQMPKMTGLEFCQKIRTNSVRKIIVSSKLPSSDALQAINEGKLRGFLNKTDTHVESQLQKLVDLSILEHFCDVSGTFQEAGDKAQSALKDPSFLHEFQSICTQLHVQEHYTVDAAGTFLLVTHHRDVVGFYVRTLTQLQQLAQEAAELGCPHAIVHGLGRGDCVLIPPDPSQQRLTQDLPWWRCVHSISKTLRGEHEQYYCAQSAGIFDVNSSQITSFYQYREQNPD